MYEKGRAQPEAGHHGWVFGDLASASAQSSYGVDHVSPMANDEITAPGGEPSPDDTGDEAADNSTWQPIEAATPDELAQEGVASATPRREHHAIVDKPEFIRRAHANIGAEARVCGRIFNKLGTLAARTDSQRTAAERLHFTVMGVGDDEEVDYISLTNALAHPALEEWGDREREIVYAATDSALENGDPDQPSEGYSIEPPAPGPLDTSLESEELLSLDAGPEPNGPPPRLISRDDFVARAVRVAGVRPQAAGKLFSQLISTDRKGQWTIGSNPEGIGRLRRIGKDTDWAFTPGDARTVADAAGTPPRTREVLRAVLASRARQIEQYRRQSLNKDK